MKKKAKKNLGQAKSVAENKGLVDAIVHDIRNPLVAIKAFFQVFRDREASLEDKLELSELAYKEVERMDEMLHKLQDLDPPDVAPE